MPKKIENHQQLNEEQARLRRKLTGTEHEISSRIGFLRRHYPEILLQRILPFGSQTNNRISAGITLVVGLLIARFTSSGKEFADGVLEKALNWISEKLGFFKNDAPED